MAPFERAMVVSYRLSVVTVALSVTIRPQFAIECLRRSNQQEVVGQFGPKFLGVPLGVDPVIEFAESEHPLVVKLFRKNSDLCDESTNVTDGRTDGQTDRQATCDRNRALH